MVEKISTSPHHDLGEPEDDDHTVVTASLLAVVPTTAVPDKDMSSTLLFWHMLWLVLAEFIYVIPMIICSTLSPKSEEGASSEEHNTDLQVVAAEHEPPSYSSVFSPLSLIFILPPIVSLLMCAIVFFSSRGNLILRKILLVVVILSLLVGIVALGISLDQYAVNFKQYDCEEFEGWSVSTIHTLVVVLSLCPLVFRFGFARSLFQDVRHHSSSSSSSSSVVSSTRFDGSPQFGPLAKFINGLDTFIMTCCMPQWCPKSDAHGRHKQQHIMQLIYEIILFIAALVEHKNIELIAIVAGILGSLAGVTRIYMMDIILNIFAFSAGMFLFGNNIARYNCGFDLSVRLWVYLLMFSLIASFIRFKSILNAYIEAHVQTHSWLVAQRPIIPNIANYANLRFFKIPNFSTLIKYPPPSLHHHTSETTSLLHGNTKKKSFNRYDCIEVLYALCLLFGLCLVVAFIVCMAVLLPSFLGGNHVATYKKDWTSSTCYIKSHTSMKDPKASILSNYIYIYQVNATSYSSHSIFAVPIQSRFHAPATSTVDTSYIYLPSYKGVPCWVPPSPLIYKYPAPLDPLYQNKEWDSVAILGSEADLDAYARGFYLWAVLPVMMMALGLLSCVASIACLVRMKKRRRMEGI